MGFGLSRDPEFNGLESVGGGGRRGLCAYCLSGLFESTLRPGPLCLLPSVAGFSWPDHWPPP